MWEGRSWADGGMMAPQWHFNGIALAPQQNLVQFQHCTNPCAGGHSPASLLTIPASEENCWATNSWICLQPGSGTRFVPLCSILGHQKERAAFPPGLMPWTASEPNPRNNSMWGMLAEDEMVDSPLALLQLLLLKHNPGFKSVAVKQKALRKQTPSKHILNFISSGGPPSFWARFHGSLCILGGFFFF